MDRAHLLFQIFFPIFYFQISTFELNKKKNNFIQRGGNNKQQMTAKQRLILKLNGDNKYHIIRLNTINIIKSTHNF